MTAHPRIHLDCLGSAFAFSAGRYWNGWLLNGRILLDCPAQTVPHLYRLGGSPADVDLVLLSHEHGDHIGAGWTASCSTRSTGTRRAASVRGRSRVRRGSSSA
ncbi:MAG: MBL fold metallo-hydrolase [Chloroflexi bacterium]|nr:MBL fold metallo-hydrolase [Chloroflexota bacterium]